jgi:gamma-glutamyl-gamma-aminobutyrate hydrolase PuuD
MLHFIPNRLDQKFDQIADELDCFIITGGDDRAIRRTTELKLATEMMKRQKPIVGICHGAFLLTDILGGVVSKKDGHRGGIEHTVTYNGQQHTVNSFHGLCIKSIHDAPNARVLATDADGDIESWIDGNIAAIVWHPERSENHWIPDEINTLLRL